MILAILIMASVLTTDIGQTLCSFNIYAKYMANAPNTIKQMVFYIDSVTAIDLTYNLPTSVVFQILPNKFIANYPCANKCNQIQGTSFNISITQVLNTNRSLFCNGFDFPVEVYDVYGTELLGVLPYTLYAYGWNISALMILMSLVFLI